MVGFLERFFQLSEKMFTIFAKNMHMGTLSLRFKDFVEKIYSLPLEDKMELKNLLELNISDVRRKEIASNYSEARAEYKSGKLKFSSQIDALKNML